MKNKLSVQSYFQGLSLHRLIQAFTLKTLNKRFDKKELGSDLVFFQDSISSSPGWAVLQTTRTVRKNLGNAKSEKNLGNAISEKNLGNAMTEKNLAKYKEGRN